MIRTAKITVTTTGSDGSATGEGYSNAPINGVLKALRVDWHASAPGTSDIDVVVESDDNHPEVTLYDKDDANSDRWVYPTIEQTDTAGTGRSTYQSIPVAGRLKVSVAGCDALDPAVVVYAFVEE